MSDDHPTATGLSDVRARLGRAVAPVVVGADEVLDVLAIAVAVGGHVLLEGVPGVAKTLVANATARALGVSSAGCSSRPTCSRPTSRAR